VSGNSDLTRSRPVWRAGIWMTMTRPGWSTVPARMLFLVSPPGHELYLEETGEQVGRRAA
jgi:hypothetical protein